jgi:hypothetical protein
MSENDFESWDLKLIRAEWHTSELESSIAEYERQSPFQVVERRHRTEMGIERCFVIAFSPLPDPLLPIILGDAIHNMRSALDHVVTALSPPERKGLAQFPVVKTDPYDASGQLLRTGDANRWDRWTRGIPQDALEIIRRVQPYQPAPPEAHAVAAQLGASVGQLNGMGLLTFLSNADKHRQLNPLEPGVVDIVRTIDARGGVDEERLEGLVAHGMEVALLSPDLATPDEPIDVSVMGTTVVGVKVGDLRGTLPVSSVRGLLEHCHTITSALAAHATQS